MKIRRALQQIGHGDFSGTLTLRRTDYLRQEGLVINDTLDTLRKRFGQVLDEQIALENVVRDMRLAIEGGSIGEMRRMQGVMAGRVQCFRNALEEFKLKPDDADNHPVQAPEEHETLQPTT
jgi:hypothetical protein